MQRVWKRIEKWLAANAPNLLRDFNPPASEREIARTEKFLGVKFTDDVRFSYLRHNGHRGLFDNQCWFSLADMRGDWEFWNEMRPVGKAELNTPPEEGSLARDGMWNPGWVPLINLDNGNRLYLDFVPGPGGRVGQVIQSWVDCDTHSLEAESFKEWLALETDLLEKGEYVVIEDTLIPRCTLRAYVERRKKQQEFVGWSFVYELAIEFGWELDGSRPPIGSYSEWSRDKYSASEATALTQALGRALKVIPRSQEYRPPKRVSKAMAFFYGPHRQELVKWAEYCERGSFRIGEP